MNSSNNWQPIGDWIQTYTTKKFWPLSPRVEDVCIEDIAHSLSLQTRFNGHCRTFYSIAQHSVLAARELLKATKDRTIAMQGLLHDASEAYICDLPRPIKSYITNYKELEEQLMQCIAVKFNLNYPFHELVKKIDTVLLATEARDLMDGDCLAKWKLVEQPLPYIIIPMSHRRAKEEFLFTYYLLKNELESIDRLLTVFNTQFLDSDNDHTSY